MAKRKLLGKIVSNKNPKTVVVRVERIKKDPKYQKRYHFHKRFKANIENGDYQIGEMVLIEECRPVSKEKKWKVIKKITSNIGETPEIISDETTV